MGAPRELGSQREPREPREPVAFGDEAINVDLDVTYESRAQDTFESLGARAGIDAWHDAQQWMHRMFDVGSSSIVCAPPKTGCTVGAMAALASRLEWRKQEPLTTVRALVLVAESRAAAESHQYACMFNRGCSVNVEIAGACTPESMRTVCVGRPSTVFSGALGRGVDLSGVEYVVVDSIDAIMANRLEWSALVFMMNRRTFECGMLIIVNEWSERLCAWVDEYMSHAWMLDGLGPDFVDGETLSQTYLGAEGAEAAEGAEGAEAAEAAEAAEGAEGASVASDVAMASQLEHAIDVVATECDQAVVMLLGSADNDVMDTSSLNDDKDIDVAIHLDVPDTAGELRERMIRFPFARHILEDPTDNLYVRAFALCRQIGVTFCKYE